MAPVDVLVNTTPSFGYGVTGDLMNDAVGAGTTPSAAPGSTKATPANRATAAQHRTEHDLRFLTGGPYAG
jgi:hypothetical protein